MKKLLQLFSLSTMVSISGVASILLISSASVSYADHGEITNSQTTLTPSQVRLENDAKSKGYSSYAAMKADREKDYGSKDAKYFESIRNAQKKLETEEKKQEEEEREVDAKKAGYKSYAEMQANIRKKADDKKKAENKKIAEKRKAEVLKKADKKKVADKIKADEKKVADKIKKEKRQSAIIKARIYSQNNPGFRDLKPGIHYDDYIKNCSNNKCYGIQNISFSALSRYKNGDKVLGTLTLDMGPIASGGILIDFINEFADPDANIFRKMKTNFDTKYILEYEFSQRDRQLFNEREKSELLVVYSKGQVALRITRDFSLYIEYRDISEARAFLKRNKPVTATLDDF